MDTTTAPGLGAALDQLWADEVLPTLCAYVRIPNVSPLYCPTWESDGHMEEAVALLERWVANRPVAGITVQVARLPGRTPVLVAEVPASGPAGSDGDPVLVYGHLDKQPGLSGWRNGLAPFTPVVEGDRLYGRGSADDGYAVFCIVSALEAAQRLGASHNRVVVLIEASEESGSVDLPAYLDHLAPTIGAPSLVIGLDSESVTYDRLWATTSLRGLVSATLRVSVLERGVHSGMAGGAVPSSFRVARLLLERVERSATGELRLPELGAVIPEHRRAELAQLAGIVDAGPFPAVPGLRLTGPDAEARLVAVQWAAALEVTGADGLPPVAGAGNVLRPETVLKLSVRVPPLASAAAAATALTRVLEDDPPDGAHVSVEIESAEDGWDAPEEPPWMRAALDDVSAAVFGRPPARTGIGGSIPFIAMLGRRFPGAGILVTGAMGADSNPHGPDEYLDLSMARKLGASLALLLDAHARRSRA